MTQNNPPRSLSLKLRLERRLAKEVAHFSRSYLNAFGASSDASYLMPSQGEWTRRLASLFARHYVRVIRSFETGAIMDSQERLDEVVSGERAAQMIARAMDQAARVVRRLETLATEAQAESMVRKDAMSGRGGNTVTLIGTMKVAWRKFARQIGLIANMQTQEVAEATQAALRESMPEYLVGGGTVYVEWNSLLDGRERASHNAAHGQRVALPSGVFTVGGASLRFPGDTGLGAPMKEVANCRCYMRTIWVKPDGTEEVIEDGRLNPSNPTRTPRKPGANPNAFTRTRPTPSFTFGYGKGPWRGAIILGNGQRANYTVRNGGVTIRVGGKPVASAPIKRDALGNWTLGNVTTTQPYSNAGIEQMLRSSVEASNRLPR
jgi:hypothetical protein